MRVAVVTGGGVPNPAQSGGTLTVWTVVRHLLAAGHQVTVVLVLGDDFAGPDTEVDERVERLHATGADVQIVPSEAQRVLESLEHGLRARLRRAFRPSDEELLPNLVDADAVRETIVEVAPDVVWAYHWEAVAASRRLAGLVPRLATVVDLPQLSALYRWRATPSRVSREGLSRLLWVQARVRNLPRLLVDLLNECDAAANFAAHHAAWLRARGAHECEYLRTPLEDTAGSDWLAARETRRTKERPQVLLIGHLRGISTLEGLDLFAKGVLPRLEEALGQDGFEARLAGGYEAPADLASALARPSVRFLGHVEQADTEFQSADVLLAPTSIPLGTRVRILSAFSFGCPVVAHEANALGIPELVDGDNVLLGRRAGELADGVLRVLADEPLRRRLERRGRETYERFFAPPVAAVEIERRLRRLTDAAGDQVASTRQLAR